ncbi:hypothetical protein QUB68_04150 [Microcoleus sp. A006_D1]|uniref:hypothetical protein n=1 Tax=Microcoleus sp. A006_D1 TaxID=3055267 RepID=UPI002FCEDEAD
MNHLLKNYCVSVEFPDVSGAEHLEMLQIRDRLAEIESDLNEAEKTLLTKADRQLIEKVNDFYHELSGFVNLAEIRKAQAISPQRWWWYLDVLVFLPISLVYNAEREGSSNGQHRSLSRVRSINSEEV